MKIAIASDHAGYEIKELLKSVLVDERHIVRDFGTNTTQSVDYPDYIYPAALAVSRGECDRAVLVDGAGYPSAALANMLFGVYAAVCNVHDSHANTQIPTCSVSAGKSSVRKWQKKSSKSGFIRLFLAGGIRGGLIK